MRNRGNTVNKTAKPEEGYKLSTKIIKTNKRGVEQTRTMLITGEAVYNFELGRWKDAFKNKILLTDI